MQMYSKNGAVDGGVRIKETSRVRVIRIEIRMKNEDKNENLCV